MEDELVIRSSFVSKERLNVYIIIENKAAINNLKVRNN